MGPDNLRIELKSVRPSVDDDAVLKLRFFFEPVSGPGSSLGPQDIFSNLRVNETFQLP